MDLQWDELGDRENKTLAVRDCSGTMSIAPASPQNTALCRMAAFTQANE